MRVSVSRLGLLAALTMLVMGPPAFAHHPMGGKLPMTIAQGLLSGLGHPVIGLDHFAAIVGAGVLAALIGRGIAPVLGFSAAMLGGVAAHLAGVDVPGGELLVGLSTLTIGLLVIWRVPLSATLAVLLFALAGAIHGYALGESIIGAETAPLLAYLMGLLVAQTMVAAIAFQATRVLGRSEVWRRGGVTVAGSLVVLVGGVSAAIAASALA